MPLPAAIRRERRKFNQKFEEKKKHPRRRCKNCEGWFDKTRKNKVYCKPQCKTEFNRYGSAFGPLKSFLLKKIEEMSREHQAANVKRLIPEIIAAVEEMLLASPSFQDRLLLSLRRRLKAELRPD